MEALKETFEMIKNNGDYVLENVEELFKPDLFISPA